MRLFCFGLGFSARRLAAELLAGGWEVAGTVRTRERASALRHEGIDAHVFDDTSSPPEIEALLGRATHVLDSIPPAGVTESPTLLASAPSLARLEDLQWCGYLSTTGVYGDHQGAWVNETTGARPTHGRSALRVAAEQAWLIMHERYGLPVHIFRLAGIYGPGRGTLEQVRKGRAHRIVKPGQVFSRIHVDDIAATLRASMRRPHPGAIYNVCDDSPESPARVVEFACRLLGVAVPEEVAVEDADLSRMAASFYADNKRVSNRKIREELGVRLRYPSYREGLAALAMDTSSPSVTPSKARSQSRDSR